MNNRQKYLLKILQKISLTSDLGPRKTHVVTSQPRDDWMNYFLDTEVENLQYNSKDNTTFFSKRYISLLQEILQDDSLPDLRRKALEKKNTSLQELSDSEFRWKNYHKRIVRSGTLGINSPDPAISKSSEFFVNYLNALLTGDTLEKTQRINRKILLDRTAVSTKALFDKAVITHRIEVLYPLLELTSSEVKEILAKELKSEDIFYILVKIIIKGAHEELVNETWYNLKDIGVSVSRVYVQYTFQRTFLLVLFNALIIQANAQGIVKDDVAISVFQKLFELFVHTTPHLYDTTSAWSCHCDDCMSLIGIIEKSGLFHERVVDRKKQKTHVRYVLPDYLEVKVTDSLKVPQLVKPPVIKKSDIDFLIKPLRFGSGSITKTNHLVESLNISCSKKFRVNHNFLKLCETVIHTGHLFHKSEVDLGFESLYDLKQQKLCLDKLEASFSLFDTTELLAAHKLSVLLSKSHDFSLKSYNAALTCVGFPKIQTKFYSEKQKAYDIYLEIKNNVGFSMSRLVLAKMLKDYPVYLTDTLCIRLRLYPKEHWISRTSGIMKHLLYDYSPTKLTLQGHLNLMLAFYTGYPDILQEFHLFLSTTKLSKKKGRSLLNAFFDKHSNNAMPKKNTLLFANYYMVLYNQLQKNSYTPTSINIEIDQTASALVFLSYILRDKQMARVSNVIGGEPGSPYDYLKKQFIRYFEENSTKYNTCESAYTFVCESRKLHKYAIMCFCYNQQHMGRIEDFRNRWYDEHGAFPLAAEDAFLVKFAVDYPNFVDFVFPNATKKLKILSEVMTLAATETSQNEIKTLNGETLRWSFYKTSSKTRRFFDIVENTYKSYKLVKTADQTPVCTVSMRRKFLSYLIHSIDSAIMRKLIVQMYKKHGVRVNHLHDCILIHPNDLDSLYDVIRGVYLDSDLYNMTENLVFAQVNTQLSPESQKTVNALKNDFYDLTDSYEEELHKFIPKHMYQFER